MQSPETNTLDDDQESELRRLARSCWFLTGATAGGKSELALSIADRMNAEIVSLDSMAVFEDMDIGTAKPTAEDQDVVPHHLIDIVTPDKEFSVSRYCELAFSKIAEIRQRDRNVLFVGGTALYLKSLIRGSFQGPPANDEFRQSIQEELKDIDPGELHKRLSLIDPLSAHKLHPNDHRRIIRALEVYHETGQPISHLQIQFEESVPASECNVFAIRWPREQLHQRIDERIEDMFAGAFVDEVAGLKEKYPQLGTTAQQAVGYREVLDYLEGQIAMDRAIELTKFRTHQFARHQETWFRGLCEVTWIERRENSEAEEIVGRIVPQLRNQY